MSIPPRDEINALHNALVRLFFTTQTQKRIYGLQEKSITFRELFAYAVSSTLAGTRLVCHAKGSEAGEEAGGQKKKVLVMGGTGRVGASTLRALAKGGDLHLIVGGRNRYHQPLQISYNTHQVLLLQHLYNREKIQPLMHFTFNFFSLISLVHTVNKHNFSVLSSH